MKTIFYNLPVKDFVINSDLNKNNNWRLNYCLLREKFDNLSDKDLANLFSKYYSFFLKRLEEIFASSKVVSIEEERELKLMLDSLISIKNVLSIKNNH